MKVKIFCPASSAMQSGRKNTKKWLVIPVEEDNSRWVNPLTGWISAGSTISELSFQFDSKHDAIKFAESQNFIYEIEEPKFASVKQKSYAANFIN
jgi:hypothetical protein